ncbi:hypothetical protein [Polaromonas naphthalenivorans]|uniref:hypothetical protein n=1 Tax=Polaromonas naphthalenivorans TaxID=216465 RepID=UPI00059CDDA7|nr:hypothetical protein [Polaromonas naphthalenivorans]
MPEAKDDYVVKTGRKKICNPSMQTRVFTTVELFTKFGMLGSFDNWMVISAAPMANVVADGGVFSQFSCQVTLDTVVVIRVDDATVLAM